MFKFNLKFKKDEELSIHELKGTIEEYKGFTTWITFVVTILIVFITYSGGIKDRENDLVLSNQKLSLELDIKGKEDIIDDLKKMNYTLTGGILKIKSGLNGDEEFNLKKIFFQKKIEEINNDLVSGKEDGYKDEMAIGYLKDDLEKELNELKTQEPKISNNHLFKVKNKEKGDYYWLLGIIAIGYFVPLRTIYRTKKLTILLSKMAYTMK